MELIEQLQKGLIKSKVTNKCKNCIGKSLYNCHIDSGIDARVVAADVDEVLLYDGTKFIMPHLPFNQTVKLFLKEESKVKNIIYMNNNTKMVCMAVEYSYDI